MNFITDRAVAYLEIKFFLIPSFIFTHHLSQPF
jgi:hypothetical protein